jgi:threonine/homoserine/homoserine lactone efflux protein
MDFLTFLLQVVIISLSGVMAPGPVTAVVLGKGSSSKHAGAFVAIGHGIVEMPLVVALLFGLGTVLSFPLVKQALGCAGGAILLVMAFDMARSAIWPKVQAHRDARSPVVAGMLLSAANPYFLLWWATIGITLISGSRQFGLWGMGVFAFVHWLCDFAWYWFLSAVSFSGGRFFGRKFQKVIFIVCAACLVFFAFRFILGSMPLTINKPSTSLAP